MKTEKPVWVKVTEIKRLTIWDNEKALRRARYNDYVKVRRVNNKIDYLLNSIDPHFLNKEKTA